jgi:hypothetical protein
VSICQPEFEISLQNEAQGNAILATNRVAQMARCTGPYQRGASWLLNITVPIGRQPLDFYQHLCRESPLLAAAPASDWLLCGVNLPASSARPFLNSTPTRRKTS